MLTHECIRNVLSSLLSKIFLTAASAKEEAYDKILFHKIGFPLVKLVSEEMTGSSRGKDVNI